MSSATKFLVLNPVCKVFSRCMAIDFVCRWLTMSYSCKGMLCSFLPSCYSFSLCLLFSIER